MVTSKDQESKVNTSSQVFNDLFLFTNVLTFDSNVSQTALTCRTTKRGFSSNLENSYFNHNFSSIKNRINIFK